MSDFDMSNVPSEELSSIPGEERLGNLNRFSLFRFLGFSLRCLRLFALSRLPLSFFGFLCLFGFCCLDCTCLSRLGLSIIGKDKGRDHADSHCYCDKCCC